MENPPIIQLLWQGNKFTVHNIAYKFLDIFDIQLKFSYHLPYVIGYRFVKTKYQNLSRMRSKTIFCLNACISSCIQHFDFKFQGNISCLRRQLLCKLRVIWNKIRDFISKKPVKKIEWSRRKVHIIMNIHADITKIHRNVANNKWNIFWKLWVICSFLWYRVTKNNFFFHQCFTGPLDAQASGTRLENMRMSMLFTWLKLQVDAPSSVLEIWKKPVAPRWS